MNDSIEKKSKIIEKIEAAFQGIERKNGITIHQAMFIDDYASEEEQIKARELDIETRWQDVPDEHILHSPSIFPYLDPQGFKYYLPAYMRFAIKFPEESSSDSVRINLVPFTSPQGEKPKESVEDIARKLDLNKKQCETIFNFLEFLKEDVDSEDLDWINAVKAWKKLAK